MIRRAALLVALTGCGAGAQKGGDDTADAAVPSDEEILAALDGYAGWSQSPSWTGIQPGTGPHGAYVQIWWNDLAISVLSSGEATLPEGSALVKESYTDAEGASLNTVTAMWKAEGETWTWIKLADDGSVGQSGAVEYCSSCHADGQDSLLTETW